MFYGLTEFNSLILHRLSTLIIGLIAVVFFGNWGLLAYMIFVVMYCRALANSVGLSFHQAPYPSGFSLVGGGIYGVAIIALSLFALFGMFVGYSFYETEINAVIVFFSEKSVFNVGPECSKSTYYLHGGFNCDTFNFGYVLVSLFFPFAIFFSLKDIVQFSRSRVRTEFKQVILLTLTIAALSASLLFPIILNGQNYFDFISRLAVICTVFLILIAFTRIAF